MKQLTNCNDCIEEKHDSCNNVGGCLCASHNHKFICDDCKKDGTFNDTHNKCEIDYINNGMKSLCQCDNIGHGRNVTTTMEIDHDDPNWLRNHNNTSGNSKTFTNEKWVEVAELIQSQFVFQTLRDTKQKDIWYYSEKDLMYLPHGDTIIDEEAQRLIKGCSNHSRSEIKNTIRYNHTMIDSKDLLKSGIINTQNCIFEPKTFEKKDHSWKYLTVSKLPFSVDYEARNLKLWKLILEIVRPQDIKLIMEIIWNLITGSNPHKKLFVFMGIPHTRKTTLMEIFTWIIGIKNFSKEDPKKFLGKNSFSTSQFVGKRGNLWDEIGNLTKEMIENQKALVGGITQDTEAKNAQTRLSFDPKGFTFIYGTNTLGINFSQLADDNSIITRFEIIPFEKVIEKMNGMWESEFFEDDEDKQSAINTIVNIVIHFKRAQYLGTIPKTEWSNVEKTKDILQNAKPKEESYFDKDRILAKEGGKLSLADIKKDFESYVGYSVNEQTLGYLLKNHGMKKSKSNGVTWFKGYALSTASDNQSTL
jgi:hypothetical protein